MKIKQFKRLWVEMWKAHKDQSINGEVKVPLQISCVEDGLIIISQIMREEDYNKLMEGNSVIKDQRRKFE